VKLRLAADARRRLRHLTPSIRPSKKGRSSCLSFGSAAKVYFGKPSANAALSEMSANAISGSIIQNGEVAAGVRVVGPARGQWPWIAIHPKGACGAPR
jgi:hypothetical protein